MIKRYGVRAVIGKGGMGAKTSGSRTSCAPCPGSTASTTSASGGWATSCGPRSRSRRTPTLSLVDAHAIAEEAHHRLLHEVSRLAEAVIHTSPTGQSGHDVPDYHEVIAHHFGAEAHDEGRDTPPGAR